MANDIKIGINADSRAADKEINKLRREVDMLKQSLRDVSKTSKQGADVSEQGFARMGKAAKSLAIGLIGGGGLLAAFRLITAEIQKQIALQEKAAGAQITLASARRDVIRNMPGASAGQVKSTLASVRSIAGQRNIDERFIAQAFAEGLSASGGDVSATQKAVGTAASFLADKPTEIGGFAGSLLDLSKVTGTTNAEVNLGLLSSVAGRSRITSPQQQARNIPRALIGMRALGADTNTASALFSALTTGAGDLTGESSGTAGISFVEQLRKFMPNVQGTGAQISQLMGNQKMAQRFLGQASFEKKFIGPIEQLLLNPQSDIAKSYMSNLQAGGDYAAIGRGALANFGIDPLERVAATRRAYQSKEQEFLTSEANLGLGAVNREGLAKVLDSMGMGFMAGKIRDLQYEFGSGFGAGGGTDTAIAMLEAQRKELITPKDQAFAGTGFDDVISYRPGAKQFAQAEQLGELIMELKELNANLKQNTEATSDNTAGTSGNKPRRPAATPNAGGN